MGCLVAHVNLLKFVVVDVVVGCFFPSLSGLRNLWIG